MRISPSEKIISLELLEKLAKSSSEQAYNEIYQEFKKNVPTPVVEYFDQNWYPIRSEWSVYAVTYAIQSATTGVTKTAVLLISSEVASSAVAGTS